MYNKENREAPVKEECTMKLPEVNTTVFQLKMIPRFLREMWQVIRANVGCLMAFVFLYAFANANITPVAIRMLLNLALWGNGTTYLGPDNLSAVLLSPVTILLVIPAILVIIFPPIFEVSGILHALSMSKIGKKTSLSGMIEAGLYACRRSLAPRNWPVILFFAVLMPLSGTLSFSSGTLSVSVPEFIRDFISANGVYDKLYKLLHLILLIAQLSYIFMLNFYSLEEKSFTAACRESRLLIQGKRIRTVLWLLTVSFVGFLFSVSASSVLSEIAIRIANPFLGSTGSLTDSLRVLSTANTLRSIFVGIVSPVVNLAAVTVLFYEYIEENSTLIRVSKRAFRDTRLSRRMAFSAALAVAVFVVLAFVTGEYSLIISQPAGQTQIVAHRGDSVRAPENTMAAFRMAIPESPDWVELDVHETADGVIIVSHDDDLSRVAGKKLFVHELTYAQTQELDVGSWFGPEFSDVRLSRLDEVLELFRDCDFGVQIEIKPTGFDTDLEEKVLQIIADSGMADRCVVTSLNLDTLLRIEELSPETITVYSMFVAWEHIENLPVDSFTIEESNVNRKLVQNIHNAGKKVFAWTANTEDTIQYLYDCGVDGILTDDPIMLKNALSRIETTGGLLRGLRIAIDRLARGY